MKIQGELINRCVLAFTVMLVILVFSFKAQAQDSTSYRSTTTTITSEVDADGEMDDDDDDDEYRSGAASPRAGIKGGVNFSNLIVDDVHDRDGRIGFHAGVYGQLFASRAFAIQPEVNFSTKGNEVVTRNGVIDQKTTFNLSYIDIPVLAVFKLGRAAEIHAGAYWAYLVAANIDTDGDLGDEFRRVDRDNFEDWDYGLVGGIGFNLGDAAQLGARYNYGLNEIAESSGARRMFGGNSKNSVAQIYLAFNLTPSNND